MPLYKIIGSEYLQNLQDVFAETQGVATIIRGTNGNAVTRPSLASWFRDDLNLIGNRELSSFRDFICQAGVAAERLEFSDPVPPPAVLALSFFSGVVGIEVAGKRIASWIIWQVRAGAENEKVAAEYARVNSLNPDQFCAQFVRQPGMTDEQFGRVVRQLTSTADLLSQLASMEYKLAETETGRFNKAVVDESPGVRLFGKTVDLPTLVNMAEVSSGVCHNIANAINSISIQAAEIKARHNGAEVRSLERVVNLIAEHQDDLSSFFGPEGKGQKVRVYLEALTRKLDKEHGALVTELGELDTRVQHIATIVRLQQLYSKSIGQTEIVSIDELIHDAVQINEAAISRHGVKLTIETSGLSAAPFDRHRILMILMNLITNAKYAVFNSGSVKKQIRIYTECPNAETVCICVVDTGVGISPKNVDRIFENGFTTKQEGHGYGLHTCITAAREMGGRLYAQSEGVGMGAMFVLELPYRLQQAA